MLIPVIPVGILTRWEGSVVPPTLQRRRKGVIPPRAISVLIRKREQMLGGQKPAIVYFIRRMENHQLEWQLLTGLGCLVICSEMIMCFTLNLNFMGILAKVMQSGYELKEYLNCYYYFSACLIQRGHRELEHGAFIQLIWVTLGKINWINLCGGLQPFFLVKRFSKGLALPVLRGWEEETHKAHRTSE